MKKFEFEEDLETDGLFSFDEPETEYTLISDTDRSVELVSKIICRINNVSDDRYLNIAADIDSIFELLSSVTFDDELDCYNNMQTLCGRLVQQNKVKTLSSKTVIGLGGQFSAGKSKFINSLVGIVDLLPEAQAPTTSIPTYIIHAPEERFIANLKSGEAIVLTREEAGAITHEFYDSYKIGFASYIESIIVETPDFSLENDLAFLDTPGYSKYDSKSDTDNVLTDKQKALEQLKLADRLIWLINIENGTLTKDDLEFLSLLNNEEKILIVLNKADKVTEEDIEKVRTHCIETAQLHGINVFGVAAYSSSEGKEFGANIINEFLKDAAAGTVRKNDVFASFKTIELIIGESLEDRIDALKNSCNELRSTVNDSEDIMNIRSFAQLIYEKTIETERVETVWRDYLNLSDKLNEKLENYINYGGQCNAG